MIPNTELQNGWIERVADYLDQLQSCVDRLDESLDEMRSGTARLELSQVNQSHHHLVAALSSLELLIAKREELIHSPDAPATGLTIREILGKHEDLMSTSLSKRCQRLSQDIDRSRERAVALFVCQFHLADLSESLLSLLRGTPGRLATYSNASDVRRPADAGGSILNKSA